MSVKPNRLCLKHYSENFAFSKKVDGNAASDLTKMTDSVYTTCSPQNNPTDDPYVRVFLDNELYVSEVVITFKNYSMYLIPDFSMFIMNVADQS